MIRKDPKPTKVPTLESTLRVVQAELVPVPLGIGRVPVPCGAGTWYRHAACTRPVPLGQGKVKSDLSPVPETGHIHTLETCPCPEDRLYTNDGATPAPTGPNLSHKVGLQGRAKVFESHLSKKIRFFCGSCRENPLKIPFSPSKRPFRTNTFAAFVPIFGGSPSCPRIPTRQLID